MLDRESRWNVESKRERVTVKKHRDRWNRRGNGEGDEENYNHSSLFDVTQPATTSNTTACRANLLFLPYTNAYCINVP